MSASSNFFLSSADGVLTAACPASSGVLAASSKNFSASAAVAPFLKASSISALFAVASSFNLARTSSFCLASSGEVVSAFSNSATESVKALS